MCDAMLPHSSARLRAGAALRCLHLALASLALALSACGGGSDAPPASPPAAATAKTIGPAGGTVNGPGGASVAIPAGALTSDITIGIERTAAGAAQQPGGFAAASAMFALTPHGTAFAVPVRLTLPFDAASLPAGTRPQLFKTNAQNQWEPVAGAVFGADSVSAQITSFSFVRSLTPALPVRVWEFRQRPGNGGETRLDGDTQTGGDLLVTADFGPAFFDTPVIGATETRPSDAIANGVIASTGDGKSYSVMAEAPDGRLGTAQPIGSAARLTQTQSFVKDLEGATLKFTLTRALIDVIDVNAPLLTGQAPIKGELTYQVSAYKNSAGPFLFFGSAGASVFGARDFLFRSAADHSFSMNRIWSESDFDFIIVAEFAVSVPPGGVSCLGSRALLQLKKPITYSVDLSSIEVGEEFTLRAIARAETLDRRGGGAEGDCQLSSVHAFLRDPLEFGGTTIETTGLTPTNRPLPPPPDPTGQPAAACVAGPGPKPEAGVLQFAAASFGIDEFGGRTQTVAVSRSGGSTGAASATFATSDGSAQAGIDYTAQTGTVFFADGESGSKIVSIDVIDDGVDETDKTVSLGLSQIGGCAALGAQTSALLTIRDDDAPGAGPSGLDPSFGNGGRATFERFGGDRSGMALQNDGKVVMAGGTFADFVLARFNADGTVDTGFGDRGKVTTDIGGRFAQEEALAVAVQGDGKIVVAGYTSQPAPTFALVRYHSDGTPDASFGTAGKVSGNVNGRAHAVAVQSDGRIVAAGDGNLRATGSDFSDIVVARFNADGTLDFGFGGSGSGQVATDLGGATNTARNVVIQSDGAIVVSGQSDTPADHTDLVRYTANGTLDATFNAGGKLTLPGVRVGQGLARQSDGRLVLAGGVTQAATPASARFVLMRLQSNGATDASFGSAGKVDAPFVENALANAIALQADGRIVAVGTRALSVNPNFVVARYNTDGSIDRGFGSDGIVSIDFFGFEDAGENVAIDRDGRIVVGGLARDSFDGYGVARVLP